MGWTSPPTWDPHDHFSAAEWNLYVRDNLNATFTAKATAAGKVAVMGGRFTVDAIEVLDDSVDASGSTDSLSFTDLGSPGPSITAVTGEFALVIMTAWVHVPKGHQLETGYTVTGASDLIAIHDRSLIHYPTIDGYWARWSMVDYATPVSGMTAGENTFTMKYRVVGGGATGTWAHRNLIVFPLSC